MTIDLNIFSIYRRNGKEQGNLPGLMAFPPPRKAARGRERESLIIALLLGGNTPFTDQEYDELVKHAAAVYHSTAGALTTALKAAAESINHALLERNLSASGRGHYVIGSLTLAALRESQIILLQCGPTHVLSAGRDKNVHLYDPALSGKGLGISQGISHFYSQVPLQPGDRLLMCPTLPRAWENALASDHGLPPMEVTRKRMLSLVEGDVNGALIQVMEGNGTIRLVEEASPLPEPARVEVPAPAAVPSNPVTEEALRRQSVNPQPVEQPSAYAIPPQTGQASEALVEQLASVGMARQFPPSIPRAKPPELEPDSTSQVDDEKIEFDRVDLSAEKSRSSEETARRRTHGQRQAARFLVNGLQTWRHFTEQVGARLRKFLPNLLPEGESALSMPVPAMAFISILVPLLVVTISVVVYMRSGRSSQYETYVAQAQVLREQALNETDPVRQRDAWNSVLQRVVQAESYSITSDTIGMRQEAQSRLDALLGITRLDFNPIFSSGITGEISRMGASGSDLFMLDATRGSILRAIVGREFQLDTTFDCTPGSNGSTGVGSLVDLVVLPKLNTLNSSVMGVDAMGNLLYCAPGQVAQPKTLPPPPTNWGRVTAVAMDGGKLYVLDAPARAVWIYSETVDGVFVDTPLIFFGIQIPDIQDAIDIAVSGDELYLLHADGRLTYCMYSHLDGVPTRCDSPVTLVNRFPAYGGTDVFAQAHFTQMMLAALPDATVILLDSDGQSLFRLSSRGFELQGIVRASGANFPAGPVSAMTSGPNHIMYLVLGDQVYATNNMP